MKLLAQQVFFLVALHTGTDFLGQIHPHPGDLHLIQQNLAEQRKTLPQIQFTQYLLLIHILQGNIVGNLVNQIFQTGSFLYSGRQILAHFGVALTVALKNGTKFSKSGFFLNIRQFFACGYSLDLSQ